MSTFFEIPTLLAVSLVVAVGVVSKVVRSPFVRASSSMEQEVVAEAGPVKRSWPTPGSGRYGYYDELYDDDDEEEPEMAPSHTVAPVVPVAPVVRGPAYWRTSSEEPIPLPRSFSPPPRMPVQRVYASPLARSSRAGPSIPAHTRRRDSGEGRHDSDESATPIMPRTTSLSARTRVEASVTDHALSSRSAPSSDTRIDQPSGTTSSAPPTVLASGSRSSAVRSRDGNAKVLLPESVRAMLRVMRMGRPYLTSRMADKANLPPKNTQELNRKGSKLSRHRIKRAKRAAAATGTVGIVGDDDAKDVPAQASAAARSSEEQLEIAASVVDPVSAVTEATQAAVEPVAVDPLPLALPTSAQVAAPAPAFVSPAPAMHRFPVQQVFPPRPKEEPALGETEVCGRRYPWFNLAGKFRRFREPLWTDDALSEEHRDWQRARHEPALAILDRYCVYEQAGYEAGCPHWAPHYLAPDLAVFEAGYFAHLPNMHPDIAAQVEPRAEASKRKRVTEAGSPRTSAKDAKGKGGMEGKRPHEEDEDMGGESYDAQPMQSSAADPSDAAPSTFTFRCPVDSARNAPAPVVAARSGPTYNAAVRVFKQYNLDDDEVYRQCLRQYAGAGHLIRYRTKILLERFGLFWPDGHAQSVAMERHDRLMKEAFW